MSLIRAICGSGGSGAIDPVLKYSPSGDKGNIGGSSISVTEGKTYAVTAVVADGYNHNFSVNGGVILGQFVSSGYTYWLYSSDKSRSVLLIIKATSNSISITDSGYSYGVYAGQVIQLD